MAAFLWRFSFITKYSIAYFQPIYHHSDETNSSARNFFQAQFHWHKSFLITIKTFTNYQTHHLEEIRYNSHPKKRLQPFITTVKNTSYRQTKTISLLCCLLQIPTSSNCLLLDASDHQLISSNCWFLVTSDPQPEKSTSPNTYSRLLTWKKEGYPIFKGKSKIPIKCSVCYHNCPFQEAKLYHLQIAKYNSTSIGQKALHGMQQKKSSLQITLNKEINNGYARIGDCLFSELSKVDDGTEHYKYIAYQFEIKKN